MAKAGRQLGLINRPDLEDFVCGSNIFFDKSGSAVASASFFLSQLFQQGLHKTIKAPVFRYPEFTPLPISSWHRRHPNDHDRDAQG